MKRLEEKTNGVFAATFGVEQIPRKPQYNLDYMSIPIMELIQQYVKIVDDSQMEIDNLHRMLDSKRLDMTKLQQENNRSLALFGSKKSW